MDVTSIVKYELSDSAIAKINKFGWVEPLQDGEAKVTVRFNDFAETLPMKVQIGKRDVVDFIRDVNPILSKLGCNQGLVTEPKLARTL